MGDVPGVAHATLEGHVFVAALDQLGLDDVQIFQFSQNDTEGYHNPSSRLGAKFLRLAWQGCILLDLIQNACQAFDDLPGTVRNII